MKVRFLDLKKINKYHEQSLLDQLSKVIHSGWFVLGEEVATFEKKYASFNQTKFCIGVGNGLDALILSLRSLGIGPGDEVIVPSNTYIASWLAISYVGAKIVPVEPRLETYNLNPDLIQQFITSNTKAIMPVNLYGQAAELDRIVDIANHNKLFVVEDNAQAQGASCNGKLTGSYGHVNATSFYPGKNLGALGDGGAVTTNNEELSLKVKTLRNYGSYKKYYNDELGVNSRLDELQSAFLTIKLDKLKADNEERVKIADIYFSHLKGIDDLILPTLAKGCTSNYHLFVLRTSRRDELQKHLHNSGVETVIHYPIPPFLQNAYSHLNLNSSDFPLANLIANTSLSIPIYPGIEIQEIEYVCEIIRKFYA
jgi:dTDP-4-amino-4,6-dideoxygalactose transaminase